MYHQNMLKANSVTWYSDTASPHELVMYVLQILGVEFNDLAFDDKDFAHTSDKAMMLMALVGPRGSVLTVWEIGSAARVNQAVQQEFESMMEELSRGAYVGSPIGGGRTGTQNGELVEHFFMGDPQLFDYVNGAEVLSMWDVVTRNAGSTSSLLDAKTVEAELRKDPDILEIKELSDFAWIVETRLGMDLPFSARVAISGRLSDEFIVFWAFVDTDTVPEALMTSGPFSNVGLAKDGLDGYHLRTAIFKKSSLPAAVGGSLRAVATAWIRYQLALLTDEYESEPSVAVD